MGSRIRRAPRWTRTALAAALLAAGVAFTASPAQADRYDAKDAGHPLRIIAYVAHPVGVVIDYLLMRPAHWLAHREPVRTLVGHTD